jgi:hypothetical protein
MPRAGSKGTLLNAMKLSINSLEFGHLGAAGRESSARPSEGGPHFLPEFTLFLAHSRGYSVSGDSRLRTIVTLTRTEPTTRCTSSLSAPWQFRLGGETPAPDLHLDFCSTRCLS